MIRFSCSCGKNLKVAPTAAGKKVKCSQCGALLRVPTADAVPVHEPPAPSPEPVKNADPFDFDAPEPKKKKSDSFDFEEERLAHEKERKLKEANQKIITQFIVYTGAVIGPIWWLGIAPIVFPTKPMRMDRWSFVSVCVVATISVALGTLLAQPFLKKKL